MSFFKYNVNPSKKNWDGQGFPWAGRAAPRKTPYIPPLVFGLTQLFTYICGRNVAPTISQEEILIIASLLRAKLDFAV